MIVDKAKIVKCPFCGTKKELLSLCTGNTFSSKIWSDAKQIAPMLPRVSPVQKCHNCGKYFLPYKQALVKGTVESFETGNLSYEEWKEAYVQFKYEQNITNRDWYVIRLGMIHAFNDRYYRGPAPLIYIEESTPPADESAFIIEVIENLILSINRTSIFDKLFKAELYREIGKFDLCEKTLLTHDLIQLDEFCQKLYKGIYERTKAKDVKVFIVTE